MTRTSPAETDLLGPAVGTDLPPDWLPVIEKTACGPYWRDRSTWFAAAVNGVVAGVGALRECPDGTTWMGPSVVLPEYRGLGLQLLLIRARLNHALLRGIKSVASAVDLPNTASLRNMLNAGFRVKAYSHEHDHLDLIWENK